jgi:regulator of sigma E protease
MTDTLLQFDLVPLTDSMLSGMYSLTNWMEPLFAAKPTMIEKWSGYFYNAILVVLGIGFVIFVHELGHFLAAKSFGVQCDKFYVGFDPPIKIGPIRLPSKLFHFQWGETEYGIGIIPLGGYVKMLGQDDDPRNAIKEVERSQEPNGQDPNATDSAGKINPRSFLAKSVFARMVIISAGVVMNLFFGVLMAAYAFYIGVPYDPAIIGSLVPGDPAWVAGVQPGDRVLSVNSMKDSEMSFRDMQQTVIFSGLRDESKPVKFTMERGETSIEQSIVGTTQHSDPSRKLRILTLGIRSTAVTQVNKIQSLSPIFTEDPAFAKADLCALEPLDVIIGVNGTPLPISSYSPHALAFELDRILEPRHSESVTLQVMRLKNPADKKSDERVAVDVTSNPTPMKTLGFDLEAGPIVSIQPDSPAAKAGIATGYKILTHEGKPINDAFSLWLQVSAMHGKSTSIVVQSPEGSEKTLEWNVPENFALSSGEGMFAPLGLELAGSGIVYSVSNVVTGDVLNSTDPTKGLRDGDKITQLQFKPTSKEDLSYFDEVFGGAASLKESKTVDALRNLQYWHNQVQMMKIGMPVIVHYERDGKVNQCSLAVMKDEKRTWPDRGFQLTALSRTHQVATIGDALRLGSWEIWRRGGNVLEFLELLFRGKLSLGAVGGPGMIAMEANDAASKGIAPLLMFLTMLSANLAIINFLPIPALDGGHMVFLILEAIRGKPVDEEIEGRLRMVGVLALLCLMVFVLFNDTINISRWLRG